MTAAVTMTNDECIAAVYAVVAQRTAMAEVDNDNNDDDAIPDDGNDIVAAVTVGGLSGEIVVDGRQGRNAFIIESGRRPPGWTLQSAKFIRDGISYSIVIGTWIPRQD